MIFLLDLGALKLVYVCAYANTLTMKDEKRNREIRHFSLILFFISFEELKI